MRYDKFDITTDQWNTLTAVLAICMTRIGLSQRRTLDRFAILGYTPVWRRVTWSGGVGSWYMMRNSGTIRILITANESARPRNGSAIFGGMIVLKRTKYYFKYGWCIEIPR